MVEATKTAANRRLSWGAVWLAVILIGAKAFYLGLPRPAGVTDALDYVRSLAAISFADLWFVAGLWTLARLLIATLARRPRATQLFSAAFVAACAIAP